MNRTILELLKKNRQGYVSGEVISKSLGVSRTAVWKHIKELKNSGYEIESTSRKGYRLIREPDLFTKDELEIGMKTAYLGKTVLCFETIDSTNRYLKEHAVKLPHGTLIVSEEQQGGRGRLGRGWVSPAKKGIWMSLLLKPDILPKDAPQITQIAAAALVEAIRDLYKLDARVKWPNDIVIGGKKVCGILTEMGAELGRVDHIVLGIGVNANLEVFDESLEQKATSLRIELGKSIDRKKFLFYFLEILEKYLDDYVEKGELKNVLDICRKHSAVLGKRIRITERNQMVEVLAVAIDEDGELVVRFDDGTEKALLSGEVSVRSGNGYI